MLERPVEPKMEIAYVLFTDLVGYSKLPLDEQLSLVEELKSLISNLEQFKIARDQKTVLTMHTGDGMALAFFSGPEAPALCALELAAALKDRTHLKLRMGIHTGPVYRVTDIQGGENAAGGGINMAQRVMDCGDAGHILLSDTIADLLGQHSRWAKNVHELGSAEVKHGVKLRLYSLYTGDAGNSELPTKVSGAQDIFPKELHSRYDVQRLVGHGGMGIVYEALDRETGAKVALKILKPEIAEQVETTERFKAELLLARKITHKNVCRVYDMSRFAGLAVIAMEYVDGESLRARLNRVGQLSFSQATEIATQIMDGLEEAHRQNIIHRDLKPENIMIARDGMVKVMDFGLAKATDSDITTSGAISGTPAYMSPEQALGQPAEVRSDIYSLGLILYEMLCGKRAFAGDSAVVVAMKQVNETPVAPRQLVPDLPEFVEAAVLRCIEKDRTRRFGSIGELRAALLSQPARESLTGRKAFKVGLVAAALIFVAAIAGFRLFRTSEPPAQGLTQTAQPVLTAVAPAPQAATPQPQQQTSGPSMAVLDFDNLQKANQYAYLEMGISEAFTSSFVRSKRFRVVERNQLEKVRGELQLNRSEFVDQATAQKIGRLVGAQYLVMGSFQVAGAQMRINARMIHVETGQIVQTDSVTGDASSALSMPDGLAERFSAQVK